MKLAVLVLVLVAACRAGGGDDYPTGAGGGPVVIGGGGGGGGDDGDAGTGDGGDAGAGVQMDGRVCLIKDLRHLTVCSDTGVLGLQVSLQTPATQTAKVATDDSGHFSIVAPLCTDCTWRVTSATDQRIVPSLMPFGTDNTIPVMGFDDYQTLLLANGQVPVEEGSVVVRVVSGGAPVPQVTLTSTTLTLDGAQKDAVFYDSDNSQDAWNQTGTQSGGVVWLPLVPASVSPSPPTSGTITLARQGGGTVTMTATVLSLWITFLTTDVP